MRPRSLRNLFYRYLIAVLGFFVLFDIPIHAQTDTVDCTPSPYIIDEYLLDAQLLALRSVYNTSYKDSIQIPIGEINLAIRDLQAIYRTSNYAVRDSIFGYCKIHCKPYPNVSECVLDVDLNFLWTQNLFAGTLPTGNDTIDELIGHYNLIPGATFSNTIYLHASAPINIMALCKTIEKVQGVNYAIGDAAFLDGNNIEMIDSGTFRTYIFDYGFTDCWNGCIGHHFWQFRVHNNCIVEYVRSYGSQLPLSNDEPSNKANHIIIFPNPATTQLSLTIPPPTLPTTAIITDVNGRLLRKEQLLNATNTLNIAELPAGLYFIAVQNEEQRWVRRFVKQ